MVRWNIYFKTKIPIHVWFYVRNLDIGALTSSLGQHIQNQWIYNLISVDTCCEEGSFPTPIYDVSEVLRDVFAPYPTPHILVSCIPTLSQPQSPLSDRHWNQLLASLPYTTPPHNQCLVLWGANQMHTPCSYPCILMYGYTAILHVWLIDTLKKIICEYGLRQYNHIIVILIIFGISQYLK